MRKVLLLTLVLNSCGVDCEWENAGVCWVNPSSAKVNKTITQRAVENFNQYTNSNFLASNPVNVVFNDYDSQGKWGEYYRGLISLHISSSWPDKLKCHQVVYVFGHEALHHWAAEHLEVSNKKNVAHDVPGVFISEDSWVNTLEWGIFTNSFEICNTSQAEVSKQWEE